MTDDIAKLKEVFRSAPVAPRPAAKRQALERAMAAFDERSARTRQRSGLTDRLLETATAVLRTLTGSRPLRLGPALAGGASLAVLTIAVLSTIHIQTQYRGGLDGLNEAPEPSAPAARTESRGTGPEAGVTAQPESGPAAAAEEGARPAPLLPQSPQATEPATAPSAPPPQTAERNVVPPDARNSLGRFVLSQRDASPAPGAADQGGRGPEQALLDSAGGGASERRDRDRLVTAAPDRVQETRQEPVATLPLDVGTASYFLVRTALANGVLPPIDAVRVEELINSFAYDYQRPADRAAPFKANVSILPSPWNAGRKLVHVGIAGIEREPNTSTPITIAKEVTAQFAFNPATVGDYRLIGYDTRLLARTGFGNDKPDADDIVAGHTVTALFEITPAENDTDARRQPAPNGSADEYGVLSIRYKLPAGGESKLISTPITRADEAPSLDAAPNYARFAAAVAAFGQILRGGRHTGSFSYDDVIALADGAKGRDEYGRRAEFVELVRLAKSAAARQPQTRQ